MFFKGLHKFDNRNLKAFNKSLLNKYLHLSNDKKFIEKVEIKKKNVKYFRKRTVRKKRIMIMMMNLMIMMIGFIEIRKIKLYLLLKQIETEL